MKATLVVLMLAFTIVPAFALAPQAEAVGTCAEVRGDDCGAWWVCVGYTQDSRGFRCTGVGIRDPVCTCPPMPILP